MRMRCAVYLRVSTAEQTTDNQRPEVAAIVEGRGFEVVEVYEEQASAVKRRPAFERMMLDARRGRFNVIVVWSLDRLGRGFVCFDVYRELAAIGVTVVSVREPWTETDGPARDLLVALMSWVSGFERARLIERTKAGLATARRKGVRLGRPPASPVLLRAAADLVRAGSPVRAAARAKGVKESTLRRHLAARAA